MAEWTDQTITTVLQMVKTNLGILSSTAYDAELTNKIKQAQGELVRQGVTDLSDTVPDLELAASYATFLWNNRNATGETDLPKSLKFMRNNRIFSAKMRS